VRWEGSLYSPHGPALGFQLVNRRKPTGSADWGWDEQEGLESQIKIDWGQSAGPCDGPGQVGQVG
jgi:hypothetical protein